MEEGPLSEASIDHVVHGSRWDSFRFLILIGSALFFLGSLPLFYFSWWNLWLCCPAFLLGSLGTFGLLMALDDED